MCSLRAGLAVAALVLSGLAVPAGAAPAGIPEPAQLQEVDGSETRTYVVPTRHGGLHLEVVHPTRGGEVLPAHGILTSSPYSVLGRNGDADDWVPRGYARMYADVVGTGNSGGCYDYGGLREKESVFELVEWVAKQPWSRGRVGMTGGSYDGTTATAAAVMQPKGLATVVPEVAISRWYDYAYSNGMRYTYTNEPLGNSGPGAATDEGFDTPLAFDFGFAVPPPVDVESPDWADRVASTVTPCDELEHTERGYDLTPDYDAFWVERDYARDAKRITVPVLLAHNWGDWNVKQDTAFRLWQLLKDEPEHRLWVGDRFSGHGLPGGDYRAAKLAWMDRWVGGVANGVEKALPQVTTQTADGSGAGEWTADPRPSVVALRSSTGFALTPQGGAAGGTTLIPFAEATSETVALSDLAAGPSSPVVVLQTPPLTRDVRLVGSPSVSLVLETGRQWATLATSLVDVDPATRAGGRATDPAATVAVTRAWADTRYTDAPSKADGTTLSTTLAAKPTDYVFRKGHRIALVVATGSAEWVLPKPYDGAPCASCATWSLQLGPQTSLRLPLVGAGDLGTLFER
jgi:X-Pro dipeptidyl-peptidase